jgi:hypothetical protein
MAMAMRVMKGGPSVARPLARLCAVAHVRYSTAAAASATTTTVTTAVATPAGHGAVVAHGTNSHTSNSLYLLFLCPLQNWRSSANVCTGINASDN